jgi:hypothetical protein
MFHSSHLLSGEGGSRSEPGEGFFLALTTQLKHNTDNSPTPDAYVSKLLANPKPRPFPSEIVASASSPARIRSIGCRSGIPTRTARPGCTFPRSPSCPSSACFLPQPVAVRILAEVGVFQEQGMVVHVGQREAVGTTKCGSCEKCCQPHTHAAGAIS